MARERKNPDDPVNRALREKIDHMRTTEDRVFWRMGMAGVDGASLVMVSTALYAGADWRLSTLLIGLNLAPKAALAIINVPTRN